MAFSINRHAGEEEKRSSSLKPERKTQKNKEKRKRGAEALQSCDHGSWITSFVISLVSLMLCTMIN